jgi:NTE family protein
MGRKRIAIACQGGGSQCAFVAGALKKLFAEGVHRRFRIIGLSGTSGGGLTAALAWVGLLMQARGETSPVEDRIIAFWRDLTARTPREAFLDHILIQWLRLVENGVVPTFANSPSSREFKLLSQATAAWIGRPEFTDLRALLVKHIDFDALPSLVERDSPVLLVGACDVREGSFKIFSSVRGEISPEALLASAAVPNLFPAVLVDGHSYWDGIFSTNPPVSGFLRKALMGEHPLPEEIWIIQVNPTNSPLIPENAGDISDRRNHLAGNLSLNHELQIIDMINLLLQEDALTDEFRARFGISMTEVITVRFIRMSEILRQGLDYPSKLSRQPRHIEALLADGEAQAGAFLDKLPAGESPEEYTAAEARTH